MAGARGVLRAVQVVSQVRARHVDVVSRTIGRTLAGCGCHAITVFGVGVDSGAVGARRCYQVSPEICLRNVRSIGGMDWLERRRAAMPR